MKRILTIDDEQVILDSVVKLCSYEGWQVDTVLDAEIGLKKIKKIQYDLIICDVMMPVMDGFQFLKALRVLNVDIPVIITTGYSTTEIAKKSVFEGGIDFLPKPFTYDELISVIKRALVYSDIRVNLLKNGASENPGSNADGMNFRRCPETHLRFGYGSWTCDQSEGMAKIGVTDLYLKTVGPVESIEMMQPGDEVFQGSQCAWIYSPDELKHQILAPFSGRIIEKNGTLENDLPLIERDPFNTGWLYVIVPSNRSTESRFLLPCDSAVIG